MKKILSVCVLIFSVAFSEAQNRTIDSLNFILSDNNISEKERILTLRELSKQYLFINKNDDVRRITAEGITLAQKRGKWYSEAYFYSMLGASYFDDTKYDTAMYYLNKAMNIGLEHDDPNVLSWAYGFMANAYNMQGNDFEALHYYIATLELCEANNWNEDGISCLSNMAWLYVGLENYEQARYYFEKSRKRSIDNGLQLSGQYYEGMASVFESEAKYDSAIIYCNKTIESAKIEGNEYVTTALNLMANIYMNGLGDLDSAEFYAQKALSVAISEDYSLDIAIEKATLADIRYRQGDYQESEVLAKEALATDTTDFYSTLSILIVLGQAQIMNNRKEDAVKTYNKCIDLVNRKANLNYQATLTEMEVRYETQKKEIQIESLKKEKYFIILLSIGVGVVLLIVVSLLLFLWRLSVQKKTRSRTENGAGKTYGCDAIGYGRRGIRADSSCKRSSRRFRQHAYRHQVELGKYEE